MELYSGMKRGIPLVYKASEPISVNQVVLRPEFSDHLSGLDMSWHLGSLSPELQLDDAMLAEEILNA